MGIVVIGATFVDIKGFPNEKINTPNDIATILTYKSEYFVTFFIFFSFLAP